MTTKIVVQFELADACEYKTTKSINEFLRNSFREFAASYNIIDYEVLNECVCTGHRSNNKDKGEPI